MCTCLCHEKGGGEKTNLNYFFAWDIFLSLSSRGHTSDRPSLCNELKFYYIDAPPKKSHNGARGKKSPEYLLLHKITNATCSTSLPLSQTDHCTSEMSPGLEVCREER